MWRRGYEAALLDRLKCLQAPGIRSAARVHDHRRTAAHAEITLAFEKDSYGKTLGQLDEIECWLDL